MDLPQVADVYVSKSCIYLVPSCVQPVSLQTIAQDPYESSFGNTTLPKSIKHKIMKLARKKRLLIGCDGSVKNGVGSFAGGVMDRNNQTAPLICFIAPLHGDFDQSTPL